MIPRFAVHGDDANGYKIYDRAKCRYRASSLGLIIMYQYRTDADTRASELNAKQAAKREGQIGATRLTKEQYDKLVEDAWGEENIKKEGN